MRDPFAGLPKNHFRAILADPPWHFEVWEDKITGQITGTSTRRAEKYYSTMTIPELCALPVRDLSAPDCTLFMWTTWPMLDRAWKVLDAWGFKYKTAAFCWMKANARQIELFHEEIPADMLCGYWTRANSEPCLLATRGTPKRLNADVRQGIIAPRREHSRKPDEIHGRIERLVAGPYLELFARAERPGWTVWGNETTKFTAPQQETWHEMWSRPYEDKAGDATRERKA